MKIPYLHNQIPNTKNYTILLKYPNQKKAEQDFQKLQQTYKLTSTAVLTHKHTTYLLCPKAVQKTRLQKILNASQSTNKKNFQKYNKTIIPLKNITLKKTLQTKHQSPTSKYHYLLLKKIGAKLQTPKTLVGNNPNIIGIATLK